MFSYIDYFTIFFLLCQGNYCIFHIRSPLKTRSPVICGASLRHLPFRKNLKYIEYSCVFSKGNLSQICTTSDGFGVFRDAHKNICGHGMSFPHMTKSHCRGGYHLQTGCCFRFCKYWLRNSKKLTTSSCSMAWRCSWMMISLWQTGSAMGSSWICSISACPQV